MKKRYKHQTYTWTNWFGTVRHDWRLSCSRGGVNFHCSIIANHGPSAGLEFHHKVPPHGDEAPDHLNCPVTGGPCWHDGTSMYAMDHLWPLIEPYVKNGEHDTIFRILEAEADRQFYTPEQLAGTGGKPV